MMTDVTKPTIKELRTRSKFSRAVATIISYIFHPALMPTMMTLALYKLAAVGFAGVPLAQLGKWVAIVVQMTLLYPVFIVFLLKGIGFVRSIHLEDAKERIIPLLLTMIFYFWAYLVFKNIDAPFLLKVLMLGNFWGIIVLFMVSIFYKISMHSMAAGGMLGLVVVLMVISPVNMAIPLFVALIIAGLMGTARLILNAHKSNEIWLGYILGILVMIAAYFYLV
ncbi:MAG: hypothetical protein EOP56_05600 [Sphingobacteriales bacterium]|nr:MAG: hypothetical protein EOP56_05600 [Sphingobacteriales bacterium]